MLYSIASGTAAGHDNLSARVAQNAWTLPLSPGPANDARQLSYLIEEFCQRLAQPLFWKRIPSRKPAYTPAARFYLRQSLGLAGLFDLSDYFGVWAHAFYQARRHSEQVEDVLGCFLEQHADCLRDLFVLSWPRHRKVAPTAEAIHAALDEMRFADDALDEVFPYWLLREFLPAHVRAYLPATPMHLALVVTR